MLISLIYLLLNTSHAFLNTAAPFCTEKDVAQRILQQTTPMTAYSHGDKYAFLVFQKQKDLTLMFDRIGDLISKKTVSAKHNYDTDVEGFALTPQDIVAFYNYTDKNKVVLNSQEEKLKNSLLENGNMSYDNGQYQLKKPVYIGAAHKNCGVGTAEHELNHLYFDSTPSYKNDVKTVYEALSQEQKKSVHKILNRLGYDDQTLSVEENLLGEFSAFFRDTRTLKASYAKEIKGVDTKFLDSLAQSLLALEKSNDLFAKCPDLPKTPSKTEALPATTPAK